MASDLTQINSFRPGINESLQAPERSDSRVTTTAIYVIRAVGLGLVVEGIDCLIAATRVLFPIAFITAGVALLILGFALNKSENTNESSVPGSSPTFLSAPQRALEETSFLQEATLEELLPRRKEILRSGNGRQVPCRDQIDSSLDPVLKNGDCVELPVQNNNDFSSVPSLALDKSPSDEPLSPSRFSDIDSSKTVHCPAPNPLRKRADFLQAGLPAPPLVIGKSDFVSLEMVRHLMADKKNLALSAKHTQGGKITNMEGALHTFVTPAGPIMMSGDYRWVGKVTGHAFQDNFVRPMILSAAIHPDFEFDTVIMPVVKIGDLSIEGASLTEEEMNRQLESVNRSDETSRNAYDAQLQRHMIYHLTADHKLPAFHEIDRANFFKSENARLYLNGLMRHASGESLQGALNKKFVEVSYLYVQQYLEIKPSVISMEALLNIYIHQVRNEFKVLNQNLPQGYVYTISPPVIFTAYINGNADLLNRFQALAFKYLAATEPNLFTNLRVLGFDDYEDKGMIRLYQQVFSKSGVQVIPFKDLYEDSDYNGSEGLALVVHNNSDAFGQNIEFEGPSSMDGMIGSMTNAACLLKRDRPDLVSDVM